MGDKIEPLLLTVEEFAEATHMSRSGVFLAIAEGRITARKNGRRTVVERAELERFVRELPLAGSPREG